MEKVFILLFLAFSIFFSSKPCLCQSVENVCRFRISGTFAHPDPQRCDLFIQCLLFQSIVRECPENFIFPSGGNQCVPGDSSTCTVSSPTTTIATTTTVPIATTTISLNVCEGINLGSISIPGDCTRFILCVLGVGELINCGNNEIFDQIVGRCVAGNPLTCEVFTTTTIATTTTTTSISSTFPTTASSSTESTSSTQSPPSIGNVCTGNNFRYVANPKSCFRYFYCLFGVPLPGECGPGTIFNESQQSCVSGDRTTCIEFTLL